MTSSLSQIEAVEDEVFESTLIILAAEDWSSLYSKDPASHAKLIKAQASMGRTARRFFREQAQLVDKFVSWTAYDMVLEQNRQRELQAAANDEFQVDVIVQDDGIVAGDGLFMKVIFEDIADAAIAGAQSGEAIYKRYLGLDKSTAVIQRYARDKSATLVGKKLDKSGNIVDNPNAKYRVSNTTRNDIRESIRTSLSLGENQATAAERLRRTITNPKRAELIAQTEAVNSFQGGLLTFGQVAGAVGKQSQALNTSDRCSDYDHEGVVPLNYLYGGLFLGPAYHPRCRCGLRLVFREELERV